MSAVAIAAPSCWELFIYKEKFRGNENELLGKESR